MIVAIEGASAAGKTTWCHRFAVGRMIPEVSPEVAAKAPDETANPAGAAAFWSGINQDRWAHAHRVATQHDWAACDTDPALDLDELAAWTCLKGLLDHIARLFP
jgi:hypothetical protein